MAVDKKKALENLKKARAKRLENLKKQYAGGEGNPTRPPIWTNPKTGGKYVPIEWYYGTR